MDKKRILIIDDTDDITTPLKMYLEAGGAYEVCVECTGWKGVETAQAFQPDLILLDVMMPDMDGRAVAAQLGGQPATQRIPITFLTAAVTKADVAVKPAVLDGHPVLSKLMSLKELVAYVQKTVGV